jgi:hypothetical protein
MAGLKAQLADKEKEIYMLSQQQDMQRSYFDEVTKISTAFKDILMRELKLNEDDLMKMLEAELDVTEAAEIDEVIKSEKVDVPSIEIVDENEIPEAEVEIPVKDVKDKKEIKEEIKKLVDGPNRPKRDIALVLEKEIDALEKPESDTNEAAVLEAATNLLNSTIKEEKPKAIKKTKPKSKKKESKE